VQLADTPSPQSATPVVQFKKRNLCVSFVAVDNYPNSSSNLYLKCDKRTCNTNVSEHVSIKIIK